MLLEIVTIEEKEDVKTNETRSQKVLIIAEYNLKQIWGEYNRFQLQ